MGRKRRLADIVLSLFVISAQACSTDPACSIDNEGHTGTGILLKVPSYLTKSGAPEEDHINDVNLIIFEGGRKEGHIWLTHNPSGTYAKMEVDLIEGRTYSFFAIANAGHKTDVSSVEDMTELSLEAIQSGNYSSGMPMTGYLKNIKIEEDMQLEMNLTRCISKISLTLDRSHLSEGISLNVRRASIGNSPKYIQLFGTNRAMTAYDIHEYGHSLEEDGCSPLNSEGKGGKSGSITLYMPENMQGDFPGYITEDEEKILDEHDPLHGLCSYIEIEMYYSSQTLISYDSNLIYRFYLGEGTRSLDVERNCHYHITVTPEDDGLSGSGWRVDKSGIGPSTPFFTVSPGNYIEGKPGDVIQIKCDYYPGSAPFYPGYDELNYDKSRGIYDYSVDEQNKEITLHLKRQGTGIVFPSAGHPVNQSEMIIVVVRS